MPQLLTTARRTSRRILLTSAAVAAAVLLPATAASANVVGTVHTNSGSPVNVRSGPHTSDSVVGSLDDGSEISLDCQTTGDTVTGKYGTSDLWDHVPASGGYVSDTYVYLGNPPPACGGTTPPPSGTLATKVIQIAQREMANTARNHEIGGYNCNYYTTALGESGTGDYCSNGWHTEEWCADFTKWVWGQAGADTSGSDPSAISFRTYGQDHGTWHTSAPKAADAIVFANHVGIVTSATGSSVTYISGNTVNPSTGAVDAIASTTISLSTSTILGYSSPVA